MKEKIELPIPTYSILIPGVVSYYKPSGEFVIIYELDPQEIEKAVGEKFSYKAYVIES